MKNSIIGFIIGVLIGAIGMYFLKKCDKIPIDVPIKIDVPIPPIVDSFPPIVYPKPIKIPVTNPINKELQKELDKVKSERDSLKVYKEFVVKRVYKEKFEDSIQTIIVDAETTGTLDLLGVKYETKPRTIKVDTVVPIKLPKQLDRAINLYIEGGIPLGNQVKADFNYKLGIDIVNKKKIIYGASYAPQHKYLYGKIGKQFNF